MFAKRLQRLGRSHSMRIGSAVRILVSALSRDDAQCPNEIEIVVDGDSIPRGAGPIRIKIDRLHGLNPTISIDAARETFTISHQLDEPLPDND